MQGGRGWALLMFAVMFVLLSGLGVAYTAYTQRQSDRRWCALLTSLDQPQVPPTTERGQRLQEQIHKLRRDLGCGVE